MTPDQLALALLCALAAAGLAHTIAYSRITWPIRHVAARWEWSAYWTTCTWCATALWSALALIAAGPNVPEPQTWPVLWLATWAVAGLTAAVIRAHALPSATWFPGMEDHVAEPLEPGTPGTITIRRDSKD